MSVSEHAIKISCSHSWNVPKTTNETAHALRVTLARLHSKPSVCFPGISLTLKCLPTHFKLKQLVITAGQVTKKVHLCTPLLFNLSLFVCNSIISYHGWTAFFQPVTCSSIWTHTRQAHRTIARKYNLAIFYQWQEGLMRGKHTISWWLW